MWLSVLRKDHCYVEPTHLIPDAVRLSVHQGGAGPCNLGTVENAGDEIFWCFAWDITVTALTQKVIHCRVVKSALDGNTSMHIFFP